MLGWNYPNGLAIGLHVYAWPSMMPFARALGYVEVMNIFFFSVLFSNINEVYQL